MKMPLAKPVSPVCQSVQAAEYQSAFNAIQFDDFETKS